MLHHARNGPQPSRRAASYTSAGMRRQAQYRIRTNNGLLPKTAGKISAYRLPSTPSHLKIRKRVSHSAMTGTSSEATAAAARRLRVRGLSCAMANPAHDALTSVNGTATATTISEFSV